MRTHRGLIRAPLTIACFAAGVVGVAWAQGEGRAPSLASEINKPFANPDVKEFVSRFKSDNREVFSQRSAIVRALGLRSGMAVADIGAGTGLFTRLIASEVGPQGKVFAVDVSAAFLRHIEEQSKKLGQSQVRVVRGSQESTRLAAGSIEMAFFCDVYHHLEDPAKALASVRRALKPGGTLVVVEFDRVKGKSTEFVLKHVRADKKIFVEEIKAAGFELLPSGVTPVLKENFFLRFRRTDDPLPKATGPVGG